MHPDDEAWLAGRFAECVADERSWRLVDDARLVFNGRLLSVMAGWMGLERGIDVRWERSLDEADALGRYFWRPQRRVHEIHVRSGLSPSDTSGVLWHEFSHAVLQESGGINYLRGLAGDDAVEGDAEGYAEAFRHLSLVKLAHEH